MTFKSFICYYCIHITKRGKIIILCTIIPFKNHGRVAAYFKKRTWPLEHYNITYRITLSLDLTEIIFKTKQRQEFSEVVDFVLLIVWVFSSYQIWTTFIKWAFLHRHRKMMNYHYYKSLPSLMNYLKHLWMYVKWELVMSKKNPYLTENLTQFKSLCLNNIVICRTWAQGR